MKITLNEVRRMKQLAGLLKEETIDDFPWSSENDADELPAKVILSSEYEGDWTEEAPDDWQDDFEALQGELLKKFKDGEDFGLMFGMGDDIFNAMFVVNPAVLQDPSIKKYIKKIMSYGGLEVEKGNI